MAGFKALLILSLAFGNVIAYHYQHYGAIRPRRADGKLFAAKYDPSAFVRVNVKKPLGLAFEEVEADAKSGVYVCEVNEGNAKSTNAIYKGLLLIEVNGVDVKKADFDGAMNVMREAPADEPLQLVFIDSRNVMKGPALLNVLLPDGRSMQIKSIKGANLRNILLDAKLELYPGSSKLTNCGGGGSCGTCAVGVSDNADWEPTPAFETKRLRKYGPSARLSCNTYLEGDATITLTPKKIEA